MEKDIIKDLRSNAKVWNRLLAIKQFPEKCRDLINQQISVSMYSSNSDLRFYVIPYRNSCIDDHFVSSILLALNSTEIKKVKRDYDEYKHSNYFIVGVKTKHCSLALSVLKNYEHIGILDIQRISWVKLPFKKITDSVSKNLVFIEIEKSHEL